MHNTGYKTKDKNVIATNNFSKTTLKKTFIFT